MLLNLDDTFDRKTERIIGILLAENSTSKLIHLAI
jgi:hypothetical protein